MFLIVCICVTPCVECVLHLKSHELATVLAGYCLNTPLIKAVYTKLYIRDNMFAHSSIAHSLDFGTKVNYGHDLLARLELEKNGFPQTKWPSIRVFRFNKGKVW